VRQEELAPEPETGTGSLTMADHVVDCPAALDQQDWRILPAGHQPSWPDEAQVAGIRAFLASLPPLVSVRDTRALFDQLVRVQTGQAFILQAGDCAEPFGLAAVTGARNKVRTMNRMSVVLGRALGTPVVRIGRLAGQFAKPRSVPVEVVGNARLPSFRGLTVNGPGMNRAERRPDPRRMIAGYHTARLVLGELAELAATTAGDAMWVSHEALLLDYEGPLVRRDPATGRHYLLSAHLPWIGERTRHPEGAHAAFLAAIANPVAAKIGPGASGPDVLRLCAKLDPHRTPGRLTLISRLGAHCVADRLPALVRAVREAGHPVIWMCDPMHGNQVRTPAGRKTRRVADIVHELRVFTEVLRDSGEWPGGVHLEIAGEDVTECLWNGDPATDDQLQRRYRSLCDARLSNAQANYIADQLAAFIAGPRKNMAN
jgi:3-deoxy-7-phosphoheptulonate synthase